MTTTIKDLEDKGMIQKLADHERKSAVIADVESFSYCRRSQVFECWLLDGNGLPIPWSNLAIYACSPGYGLFLMYDLIGIQIESWIATGSRLAIGNSDDAIDYLYYGQAKPIQIAMTTTDFVTRMLMLEMAVTKDGVFIAQKDTSKPMVAIDHETKTALEAIERTLRQICHMD